MKTVIAVLAMMMVVLSYGAAYAIDDQMPTDIGISNVGPVAHDMTDWSAKDTSSVVAFASGEELLPLGPSSDLGVVIAREDSSVLASGAAAGGLGASAAHAAPSATNNWYNLAY